jgi:hypothetical protein
MAHQEACEMVKRLDGERRLVFLVFPLALDFQSGFEQIDDAFEIIQHA